MTESPSSPVFPRSHGSVRPAEYGASTSEAIRDSMLYISGALDLNMGGPGFRFFKPNSNYVRVYEPKDTYGAAEFRRMVYALKVRMEKDEVFGSFDCPDAGQICTKRSRSTTPIQAFGLFNSHFVLQQADLLKERARREAAGDKLSDQVKMAFMLVFHREPDPEEWSASLKMAKKHGLQPVCRVLLNTSEFLFMP